MDINTLTMPVELIVIPFVEMVLQPRYSTNGRCETEKLEDNTKPGNLEHH
jgi:hypothetical protein